MNSTTEKALPREEDPLEEIYRIKKEISKEYNYDVRAIAADLQKKEANMENLVYPDTSKWKKKAAS